MDKFWDEIQAGEIQFRDRWQFELKSDFVPISEAAKNEHLQEFYIFVPNALLINPQTYTANDFFKDQSNLFRYKTPVYTFEQINDVNNPHSPLEKLLQGQKTAKQLDYELRLLGNIVRSALREDVRRAITPLRCTNKPIDVESLNNKMKKLGNHWIAFRKRYDEIKATLDSNKNALVSVSLAYVDEFFSISADYYFVGLLKHTRALQDASLAANDALISTILTNEKNRRSLYFPAYADPESGSHQSSNDVVYRQWLLNKYIMDVLSLSANRDALMHKHRNLIGSIAAGIAMLTFLLLYTTQAIQYVQSSQPYILLTVVFYILKDRIKEGLRSIPSIRGFGWLANYRTEIRSQDDSYLLGTLMELFTFVNPAELDPEIVEIRNKQFHTILEAYQRPEKIMYYKKRVNINHPHDAPLSALNVISWFNISPFVTRAGEPYTNYTTYDTKTQKIVSFDLPKTYHINIILKNTYTQSDLSKKTTIQKFRLIIDKTGIKEVQQLS